MDRFLFGYIYLEVELLSDIVTLYLTFSEIAKGFSKVVESFYIPHINKAELQFIHIFGYLLKS